MPLYDYTCPACDAQAEEFRSVAERNNGPVCKCGDTMRKVISLAKPIGDLQPYFDDNLETYVRSKQHRREVMREKGVSEKFGTNWLTAASSKRHARR